MGQKKAKVPEASPEEQMLQKAQLDILNQQRTMFQEQQQFQKTLMPFLAQQAGFKLEFNPDGSIKGVSKINDPLQTKREEIERLQLERSEKALRGELPVDPVLERDLESSEQTLRERLRSQFGAGYETSSAGIETLDKFSRSAEGLRSDARTGQLTLAEQLSLARQGMGLERRGADLGIFQGATMGNPMALFQAGGQLAGGYGGAMSPFMQRAQMQTQANMFNAQNSGGFGQLAGQLFGTIAGSALGGPLGGSIGGSLFGGMGKGFGQFPGLH